MADIEAYSAPLLTFPILTQAAAVVMAEHSGAALVLVVEQFAETTTVFGNHGTTA